MRASEQVEWWFFLSGRKPHLSESHSQLSLLRVTDGCILVCSHQATSVDAFVSLTKSPFWKSRFPRLNPVHSPVFSSVTIRLSKMFIWVFPYGLTEETMNFLVNSISFKLIREFQKKKKGFHLNLYAKFMSDLSHFPSERHLGRENMYSTMKKAHWKYSSC